MILKDAEIEVRRKSIIMAITEEGGIGPKMFQQLLLRLGPPEEFMGASAADLEDLPRLNEDRIERLLRSLENVDDYLGRIHDYLSHEVHIRSILEDDYPAQLKTIDNPPPLIYFKGDASAWSRQFVAIVGTTRATQGGLRLAVDIAREFVRRGYGIISGMASGIDSAAHLGAIKEEGVNIAVLGSGILNIYPEENITLAELITQTGLLISEQEPSKKVNKSGLILRNRIISALSKAVVVVQVGDETRGELHTAEFAVKQTKPLFYGDPDGDLDYQKVSEWPGAIINSVDSVDDIIRYMV